MALPHRNLVSDLCEPYCVDSNESALSSPPSPYDYYPPPSPPPPDKASLPIILDMFIAAVFAAILLVAAYTFYIRRRRSRARDPTRPDEFLDLDHGPVADHHVWYINTVGLQQSLVDSIAVFRYKSGEGVVEGTECSVCLSEFREDEALRLLPKCSHAFHVPCIDTWLRSHTNCPICRAPIVSDSAVSNPETQVSGEDDERTEEARDQERSQKIRRSFSLGILSSSKLSIPFPDPLPEELDRNSGTQIVKSRNGSRTERNRVVMNQRGSGSSSRSMMRSVSCSGQLFSSRNSRSRSSILPL